MNYQSAIRGEALTLPAIEGGFGTMNIARDPPKSYFTRYKPKVFDTNQITEMLDASGDRACEAILKYGRGRNPMVSVSYSNNGTNGGQYRFGNGLNSGINSLSSSSASEAFLPYRVAREGAFRPPIIPPEQLLPLSRQPRPMTSQYTNKGSSAIQSDITKCNATDMKALRTSLLKTFATAKPSFIIETPQTKTYDVNDKIVRNKRGNMIVDTTKTETRGMNALEFKGNQFIRIQDHLKGQMSTNQKGQEQNRFIHRDKELSRNIPSGAIYTNKVESNTDLNGTINGRNYYLPPKASLGGISNEGFLPTELRQDQSAVQLQDIKSVYRNAQRMSYGRA